MPAKTSLLRAIAIASPIVACLFFARPVRAESGPPVYCGLTALAPRFQPGSALIPANVPALEFSFVGTSLDTVTLKATDGEVVATSTDRVGGVFLRLAAPLRPGVAYTVTSTATCPPHSRPVLEAGMPVVSFAAGPASDFPVEIGSIRQSTVDIPVAKPVRRPALVAKLTPEARAFLPVTRFTLSDGDRRPLPTAYGGDDVLTVFEHEEGEVLLTPLDQYCIGDRRPPAEVTVSAFLAGQEKPYATVSVPIDVQSFCEEEDRELAKLREEVQRSAAAASSTPDDGAGCSVTSVTSVTPRIGSKSPLSVVSVVSILVGIVLVTRRRRAGRRA